MKFGETLSTHLTPEWRKQYIIYSALKQMIYNGVQNAPVDVRPDSRIYESYVARFDEDFFQVCEEELLKIETFFAEKLAEAKRKFHELRFEVEHLARPIKMDKTISNINLTNFLPKRTANNLKFVMSEYYLSLVLLQNFQTLNHTGFRKILKKHDKNLRVFTGQKWFQDNVEKANFATNTEIKHLIEKTEDIFTKNLEGGNRSRAMKRLRVPPFEELQSPWRTFRLGLAMGAFLCLIFLIIISVQNLKVSTADYEILKHLHRPTILITLFLFLMGINIYGWQKAGVNHILIFEINPRIHLTATHILEIAAYFALFCALSFFCSLYLNEPLPQFAFPYILILVMIFVWFNPLPVQWSSRLWLMKVVVRIICAPFFQVGFADFWLADQLNSLSLVFADCEFLVCFLNKNWHEASAANYCKNYSNVLKAILLSLPAWWRFAQSLRRYYDSKQYFPFLINAGKYASSFPVNGLGVAIKNKEGYTFEILFFWFLGSFDQLKQNPYFWCLLVSRIVNTVYCYSWDIFMDFGLFKKYPCEHLFLRDEILYAPYIYYLVVIEDLLLRLYWVFALIINANGLMSAFNVAFLGGVLEVFRRYIWNFIRLENEHLNNAGLFRAVRDISIVPLTAEDQKHLERAMDQPDGVENRNRSDDEDEDD